MSGGWPTSTIPPLSGGKQTTGAPAEIDARPTSDICGFDGGFGPYQIARLSR
jgi:hypothetical protein